MKTMNVVMLMQYEKAKAVERFPSATERLAAPFVRRLGGGQARGRRRAAGEDAGGACPVEGRVSARSANTRPTDANGMKSPKNRNFAASRLQARDELRPDLHAHGEHEHKVEEDRALPSAGTATFTPTDAGDEAHAERDEQRRRRRAEPDALDLHAPEPVARRDDEEQQNERLLFEPGQDVH